MTRNSDGVPIVAGHFLAVLWHLRLLIKVEPSTPAFLPPLLVLINLLPVAGLVALAKGLHRLAAIMISVPLGVALVIGVYAHFSVPDPTTFCICLLGH